MEERKLTLVENEPIVRIENLSKQFDTVLALDSINVEIPEGRIIGLLGPNGSGKTTLLKILAGLYTTYTGKVLIEGEKPGAKSKAIVSYLPDRPAFARNNTPKDIMDIYQTFFADFRLEKFISLMERFEIGTGTEFREMSKGMIDKVQISLAMSRDARLYLLDEPLGGVDVAARENVLDAILENFDSKGTIVVATHLISEVERLFDSAIVLKKGKLMMNASCDDIREKHEANLEDAMKEVFSRQDYD